VIFVQGVPRSGTTVLVALLAAHPQIQGVEAESHLFDFGVDRLFDNFEGRHPNLHGLSSFFDQRGQLVDLARDLCDGVLLSMRSHVGLGQEPALIVEKTPTSLTEQGRDLQRKRECFPDAWYLHIVRDGEAVTRSLMRAPWLPDRSRATCSRMWRETIEATRNSLGDHPRYREVSHEQLKVDPVRVIGELYGWLNLDSREEALEAVEVLSREQFSELGAVPVGQARGGGGGGRPFAALRSRTPTPVRDRVGKIRRRLGPRARSLSAVERELSHDFVRALRERNEGTLKAITTSNLSMIYRSADGDVVTEGPDAHRALFDLARSLFGRGHMGEWWASTGVGVGESWTSAPGQPHSLIFLSAHGGDASRVDLALCLSVKDGSIVRVVVLSAGPLEGRPLHALPASTLAEGIS
jgi:hypothetical protein